MARAAPAGVVYFLEQEEKVVDPIGAHRAIELAIKAADLSGNANKAAEVPAKAQRQRPAQVQV